MTSMDAQVQIWRSSLDLWRRMFDLQLELAQGMLDMTAAWTWRVVDVARDTAEVERRAADEAEALVAEAPAPAAQNAPAAPVESAAKFTNGTGPTTKPADEAPKDVLDAAADQIEAEPNPAPEASESAKAPKPAAESPKKRRPAAARRSTSKTSSAPRPRRKPA